MNIQKVKIFLGVMFLIIFFVGGGFIYMQNQSKSDVFSKKDNFDPNQYETVESYLKTISVEGVDLLNKPFYIKNKHGNIDTIQKIDIKNTKSDFQNKNELLVNIQKAYTSKQIFPESKKGTSGIENVDPALISKNAKFFQDLLDEEKRTILNWTQYKIELERKTPKTTEEIKKLGFIYDVEGEYGKKDILCATSCKKDVVVNISGVIKDQKNNPISNAKVYLLNDHTVFAYTDSDGKYALQVKSYDLSVLRLRAIKENFSDSLANIYVVFESKEFTFGRDFVLAKPLKIQEFTQNDIKKGELKISGDISNYKINMKGLVDKDGKQVTPEKIIAYLFEYNRSNLQGLDNYFHLDIFDVEGNYQGNTFVTYGMPYLILKDENGKELYISKKNPAFLEDNIADIKDLLSEKQDIGGNKTLTKENLDALVQGSNFVHLSQYAKENKIIMPYKWNLNVKKGVWEESAVKFLNSKNGKAQTVYYNID